MIRTPSLSLLAFLLAFLTAPAQVADGERETAKGRQAWIMATSLPEDVKSPINVLIGDAVVEVEIMKRSLGNPIKVPKDGVFHVVNPITDSEGKPAYDRLVSLKVPDGIGKALIILFPDPNLPPPLRFRSKVIDLNKFRGGDALFINLTAAEIGVTLGEKKLGLKSGQTEMINMGGFAGKRNATVSYHYRGADQKTWNLISSSTAMLLPDRREILVFSYDEQLGQIDYHGLSFPGVD